MKIYVDELALKTIRQRLDGISGRSRSTLRTALNKTAERAYNDLIEKAREQYIITKTNIQKDMTLKKASAGKLIATIATAGEALEIKEFSVSSLVPFSGVDVIKAKVLRKGKRKALIYKRFKAFVAKFKNQHISVVQRTGKASPRSKLGDGRYIKKILSPSVPQMIGSEKEVWGEVEPRIKTYLDEYVTKEINRILGGVS